MKATSIEILGMWWKDNWFINFHTVDGRDGECYYVLLSEALWKYGNSFEAYLGKAYEYADAEQSKALFDAFGWIFKRFIEEHVYPNHPAIMLDNREEKSQE